MRTIEHVGEESKESELGIQVIRTAEHVPSKRNDPRLQMAPVWAPGQRIVVVAPPGKLGNNGRVVMDVSG